ncbi:MAG: hypothetical protein ACLQVA_04070 [Candidatus Brocadiia bacterium]
MGQFIAFALVNAWVTYAVLVATGAASKIYSDFDVHPAGVTTVAEVGLILPVSGFLFSIAGVVLALRPGLNEQTLTRALVIAASLELCLLGALLIILFTPVFSYFVRLGGY